MKVVLSLFLICSTYTTIAQDEVGVTELLAMAKNKTLKATPAFIQYIQPHLLLRNASMGRGTNDIVPRTYITKSNMTIDELVATYKAPNPVELHDLSSLLKSYKKGNFSKLRFSKDHPSVIVVVYRDAVHTEEYAVQLLYSKKLKEWIIDAMLLGDLSEVKSNAQFVTY